MKSEMAISRDMTIDEIFQRFPSKAQKLAQLMTNAGLHCVGCHASTFESVEQGMLGHGMSIEEVDSLVIELNKTLEERDENKEDIKFTEIAADKCKSFRKNPNHMFKISLIRGSCGWTYDFKFREKKAPAEVMFEDKGVKILLDKEQLDKFKGMVIDYVDGLQNAGFKILNPNVTGTCGCGSSVML